MASENLEDLEKKVGVVFDNKDLLQQAVTHRSYLNENPEYPLNHNERLEFLGDAVLELSVTDHLFHNFPDLPEGEMTNLRAAVVKGEMLSQIAEEVGIEEHLLLSRGEAKDTGKARQYILANSVEAVIGAIYLDQGYAAADKFITANFVSKLKEVIAKGTHIDAKSKFQEMAQEKWRTTPSYKVLHEEGVDHDKIFTVGVFVGNTKHGEGTGSSKQEAQQDAARDALK